MINFSIIIPVYNEALNIQKLLDEIFNVLKNKKYNFELIIIDDGSVDETINLITILKNKYNIIYKRNKKNFGQSFSIREGILISKYDTIITIDGDGQNNPINILDLLEVYGDQNNYQLVSGIRRERKDSLLKKISSIIANRIRSFVLGDNCKDTGCSLKIFNKKAFNKFPFFNGIHRFIPSLFEANNLSVKYIEVDHRPRIKGKSKYGTIDRLFKGLLDLYKVYKIIKKIN